MFDLEKINSELKVIIIPYEYIHRGAASQRFLEYEHLKGFRVAKIEHPDKIYWDLLPDEKLTFKVGEKFFNRYNEFMLLEIINFDSRTNIGNGIIKGIKNIDDVKEGDMFILI